MCGIFGSIGGNELQNRMLAVLAEERGRQSAGFWADGLVYRIAGSVREAIIRGDVSRRVMDAAVLLGHTRHATHGAVTVANAHPFTYGNITGAHNGIVSNFEELRDELGETVPEVKTMQVDSQLIFWLIDKHGPEKALPMLEMYAGLWWLDKRQPGRLWLYNFDCQLSFGYFDGALLFASDRRHLRLIGCKQVKDVKDNGRLLEVSIPKRQVIAKRHIRAQRPVYRTHWSMYGSNIGAWYDGDDWREVGKRSGLPAIKGALSAPEAEEVAGEIEDYAMAYYCRDCNEDLGWGDVVSNERGELVCAYCRGELIELPNGNALEGGAGEGAQ